MTSNLVKVCWVCALAAFVGACGSLSPYTNEPLSFLPTGYRFEDVNKVANGQRDTLVVFALSGGGIRSAAFAYGALKAAQESKIMSGTTMVPLTDRIDIISGVSGGAFTAAAFVLHRDEGFFDDTGKGEDCESEYCTQFLTYNFNADIIATYLEPWRWQWMVSSHWGTNDQMAEYYRKVPYGHDRLFGERTFAGLIPRDGDTSRRPFLVIQATDYVSEQPVTFTQNDFDLLCSDVRNMPITRALAAANGFPILFSPIELKNYAASANCPPHQPPEWTTNRANWDELSRRRARAIVADHFQTETEVELVDGGVADNLALRGIMNIVTEAVGEQIETEGPDKVRDDAKMCELHLDEVRQILVVSVDGEAKPDNHAPKAPIVGGIGRIVNSVLSTSIESSNFETVRAAKALTEALAVRIAGLNCPDRPRVPNARTQVNSAVAHVSFDDLYQLAPPNDKHECTDVDRACNTYLLARSPTSLHFSPTEVSALVAAGHTAFLCNSAIDKFLGTGAQDVERILCAADTTQGATVHQNLGPSPNPSRGANPSPGANPGPVANPSLNPSAAPAPTPTP